MISWTTIHTLPSNFNSFSQKSSPLISPPRRKPKAFVAFTLPQHTPPPPGEEEARWIREEHRWLREEQRWLREEQRWNDQRQALLQEITALKLRIHQLETLNSLQEASVPEIVAHVAKLVQEGDFGKNVSRIPESGSSAVPLVVDSTPEIKHVIIQELVTTPQKTETTKKLKPLQKGSQGDDVRAMQEALLKLGYYSGDEDMEYSSFSSGTERAVKTWQATLGVPESGVMSIQLLETLFNPSFEADSLKTTNNTTVVAIEDVSQVEHAVTTEVEESQGRVFLLGENRWEEPSRLNKGIKKTVDKKTTTTPCISCRGEGRLLCMECDGTGEPNVEPQFTEWIDEGMKCPYCNGLGYTTCDVCGGRK